jgi:copper chaperone CopZ
MRVSRLAPLALQPPGEMNMNTETWTVTGMTCGHCAASVTEEISEIAGVDSVDVVVETGAVTVTSAAPLDPAAVQAAVEEAGYQLA